MRNYRIQSRGFSLVELLVSIGIIALLISISIPVVNSVRKSARNVECMSNMRQLAIALTSYAGQNKGSFPPNIAASGQFWYLESLIGPHVTAPDRVSRSGAVPAGAEKGIGLAGGVFRCPNDLDDAVRSYSMNMYASGGLDLSVYKHFDVDNPPGQMFKPGNFKESSRMILLIESWPELPIRGTSPTVYAAQAQTRGFDGTPGERFGGGAGIVYKDKIDATPGRFALRASQITFYRHARTFTRMEDPHGRANFAFVDGHVELLEQGQLVTPQGKSTYLAMWSPIDREVESRP